MTDLLKNGPFAGPPLNIYIVQLPANFQIVFQHNKLVPKDNAYDADNADVGSSECHFCFPFA